MIEATAATGAHGADRGKLVPFTGRQPAAATPLRVALIGTFPPRKCGIATFTSDSFDQLGKYHPEIALDIFALDNPRAPRTYPADVHTISCASADAYERAARLINGSGADVVWLQHEFGIFGGPDGEMVCDFVDRIAAPLVVTMHTVLSEPSANQRRIAEHLIGRASRIMVMSERGRDLLVDQYDAPADRIALIAHGAPDRPFGREAAFKALLGLEGRPVLTTFGLLGPGKGLELMIEALPAIAARHPDVVYRIVGATHPVLVEEHGETYREGLQALARKLGVESHIRWENRFVETDELLDQLEACDIYVTPYLNLQQATSGTLSYAVALGKAVVSTPYVHARELLADGIGVLVEPGSSAALAEAVIRLLDRPDELAAIKRRAYAAGRGTIWPAFAKGTASMLRSAAAPAPARIPLAATPPLTGVFAMSDGTGMLQHADGIVPDRAHGYCTDDNVRALMLMNVARGIDPAERTRWSTTYAAFVRDAWNPEARRYRNFMRFDRSWCEEVGSDDSNGRTLWALGHTAARAPEAAMREWARTWFDKTAPALAELDSPRTIAFTMLGSAEILSTGPHPVAERILADGGRTLHALLDAARRPDWAWFEAVLAYDNPRLPQALIAAGMALGRDEWVGAGLDTLRFIAGVQTSASGQFRPVGSEGFGREFDALPFDQQPLEAQAAVEAAATAYAASGDATWIEHAEMAYRWYLGANDRGVVLADITTGRCRDGVTPRGANANCGAESILAFQLAHHGLMMLKSADASLTTAGDKSEPRPEPAGQSAANS
ncbi:glycosyltransferase [Parablastomonas sp. CN1-191]|uniref:glycosyltransferase n=1 Tax=Parablastomonas sp. CN1-191 TaxID=3400908 RepID=UPI003BF8D5C6